MFIGIQMFVNINEVFIPKWRFILFSRYYKYYNKNYLIMVSVSLSKNCYYEFHSLMWKISLTNISMSMV